ncbi:hypothetical protein J437_LFUL000459 [Ladona fulva]|uniref:NHR domain-containing protein n=1 Tax=Ladona fulva TaxID=123851 RepID=A0A8K0KK64_LADFU|nr:hypothetical protein J437_LFUL000459 [Ladona fulva]
MTSKCVLMVVILLTLEHFTIGLESDEICKDSQNTSRSMGISIKGWKNETGNWVTKFSAWKDTKIPSSNMSIDISQKVIECAGREIVYMEGIVNDVSFEDSNQELRFHPNCGKNAAISNDGRSVVKLNLDDPVNGVVLTNRPLKNNELFEMRLDKKNTKFQYSFCIGVTTYAPNGFNIPDHMYNLKFLMEFVFDVGDRVGVMRNNFGTLHYFVNGVDMGPAASNVPYPIYGVFELYYNTVKATIVNDPVNGVVLTNRPLKNNELFEMRLDKKNTKFKYSLGIGVTIYSPKDFKVPDHMWNLKNLGNDSNNNLLKLSINAWKNYTGKWVTKFSAWKDATKLPSNITLDITQEVLKCAGSDILHLQGIVSDAASENGEGNENLHFHPNCGQNAAISNDGLSVEKIKMDDPLNGVVLTNRPLKNNELFEVRLDKKHTKFKYSLGIGVTIYSPKDFKVPDHMWNLKSGNWMMYHADSYKDGDLIKQYYGRNFNELVVGDRIGVMRNNFGTLHYFVNGVDMGPAASNVPSPVYGVLELYYNAAKGTIIQTTHGADK